MISVAFPQRGLGCACAVFAKTGLERGYGKPLQHELPNTGFRIAKIITNSVLPDCYHY